MLRSSGPLSRPVFLSFVLCAALSLSAAFAQAAEPKAGTEKTVEPKLYLSWGAPYGQPGAHDRLTVSNDSTKVDTLYLSFDPGMTAPQFCGLTAVLYFWPQPGDTLGAFWHFQRSAENPMAMRLDFEVTPFDELSPWGTAGMGMPRYDNTSGSGRLSFIYAIPATEARQLEGGKIYALARLTFNHKRARLGGHRQPLCIEWGDANLALSQENQVDVQGKAGSVVSWASKDGKACEGFGKNRGAVTIESSKRGWNSMPSIAPPGGANPDSTSR